MIKTTARAVMLAANSTSCQETDYKIPVSKKKKRSLFPGLWPSSFSPLSSPHHWWRRDRPDNEETGSATWCQSISAASVEYYSPWWRQQANPGPSYWLNTRMSFGDGDSGTNTACEVLEEYAPMLQALLPEFIAEDIEVEEAIQVICDELHAS